MEAMTQTESSQPDRRRHLGVTALALGLIAAIAGCLGDNALSLDASSAVRPDAPSSVTAVAGSLQATVSWAAPASDGGAAITSYTVTSNPGGVTTATIGATTATVIGLSNGTSYTFTVTATNVIGEGPASTPSTPVTLATVPAEPTATTAFRGNQQVAVSWTPPASDGGAAITGYRVISYPGGVTAATTGPANATVNGLTNGTSYTFTVAAINAIGEGPASSPSAPVTPATVPDAPTSVASIRGNAQAVVSWTPPTSDGGAAITTYTVTSNPGGLTATTTGATTITMSGLTNGTSYTFTAAATNAIGEGAASTPSNAVTPVTVPDAPTSVTAIRGNAQATVSWTPPTSDGGATITTYTVISNPGSFTATTSATIATVNGLTNGTSYTFTVTATSANGTGPASTPSNAVTPATIPDAPTSIVATRGNAQATVSWTPPGSTGGTTITAYTVTSTPGGLTATTSGGTIATVNGLTNGTSYTFTVTATNANGEGPASTPSNPVTPATVPGAPTAVSATPDPGQATVSWTAPASNGGATITTYTVTSTPGGVIATTTGATTGTVTGLTIGTTYTFTVTATNAVGEGPASTPSSSVVIPQAYVVSGFTPLAFDVAPDGSAIALGRTGDNVRAVCFDDLGRVAKPAFTVGTYNSSVYTTLFGMDVAIARVGRQVAITWTIGNWPGGSPQDWQVWVAFLDAACAPVGTAHLLDPSGAPGINRIANVRISDDGRSAFVYEAQTANVVRLVTYDANGSNVSALSVGPGGCATGALGHAVGMNRTTADVIVACEDVNGSRFYQRFAASGAAIDASLVVVPALAAVGGFGLGLQIEYADTGKFVFGGTKKSWASSGQQWAFSFFDASASLLATTPSFDGAYSSDNNRVLLPQNGDFVPFVSEPNGNRHRRYMPDGTFVGSGLGGDKARIDDTDAVYSIQGNRIVKNPYSL